MPAELAEPPVTPAAQEFGSMEAAFTKALGEQRGEPAQEPKEKEPEPESKAPDTTAKEPENKEQSKPASALDAAMSEPAEQAKEEAVDPLKEFNDKKPHWTRAKEVIRTQFDKIRQLEEAASKAVAPNPEISAKLKAFQEELETTKRERDELRDSVVALNVDYDPEVRSKFVDGRNKLLDKAAFDVKQFGGDQEGFLEAMKLQPSKARTEALKAALAEVDEIDRPAIFAKLEKIRELDEEHAELKKDPQQSWEKLEQKRVLEQQQRAEEADRLRESTYQKVVRDLPKSIKLMREVDPSIEGADEHNAARLKAIEEGYRYLKPGVSFEETAALAVKGALYDRAEAIIFKTRAELAEAKEELARYHSSEPNFRGGTKPEGGKLKSPGEIYEASIRAARSNGED